VPKIQKRVFIKTLSMPISPRHKRARKKYAAKISGMGGIFENFSPV